MFRRLATTHPAAVLLGAATLALTLVPAAAATAAPPAGAAPQAPAVEERAAAGAPGIAARPDNLVYLAAGPRNEALDGMRRAGVKWVRFDLAWKDVQPDRADQGNWDTYDRVVAGITSRGMKPLAVVGKTPRWAVVGPCDAPYPDVCTPDQDAFARFTAAAARRYTVPDQPQVRTWEIWNEPNNTAAWRYPDPVRYANLLVAASQAIRGVDPTAFVLTGGLAPVGSDEGGNIDEVEFLRAVYGVDGAQAAFAAVAAHPYAHPRSPCAQTADSGWWQMAAPDRSLRAVMVNRGDRDKQIWMTEYGAPTAGATRVTEAEQARFIRLAFGLAKNYAWAGPLFVYTWQDSANRGSENTFGLLREDGTAKPARATFGESERC